jgi:hypothetical protein
MSNFIDERAVGTSQVQTEHLARSAPPRSPSSLGADFVALPLRARRTESYYQRSARQSRAQNSRLPTQVPPTCVAGMREKAYPAVHAVGDAAPKLGVGLQHRVQRGLILPDKRLGAIELMPIRAKGEKLLDGDDKKASASAILLIVLNTPSSYLFDANASRGRTRFFMRNGQELAGTARTNGLLPIAPPARSICRAAADPSRVTS